jgi:hypothetical protein
MGLKQYQLTGFLSRMFRLNLFPTFIQPPFCTLRKNVWHHIIQKGEVFPLRYCPATLGSNDRYCLSVVVLGIIFNFYKDTILDSFKNVWPPLKHKNLKFDTSIRRCCKSLQHQLML